MAASVVVSCRRIVVRLSGSWPNRDFFEQVGQHVCSRPAGASLLDGIKRGTTRKSDWG